MSLDRDVIFFDGVCNLCDGFIDFVVARDSKKVFYISSLQGKAAQQHLKKEHIEDLNTVQVLLKNGKILTKSKAVLYVLQKLGGVYSLFFIFKLLPSFVTDFFYNLIASNRYRMFGKKETCRIPNEEERSFFID